MKLHTYTNEIIEIAKANDVSWDVGKDMFLANIRSAGQQDAPYYYQGAEDVDYAALQPHLEELEKSTEDFMADYRANQTELIRLRREEDYEAVKALMLGNE